MKKVLVKIFSILCLVSSPAFASVISDFAWVPATPGTSASSLLSDGTTVTMTSSTVPFKLFGTSAVIQDATSGNDSTITLSFDRMISTLSLSIRDLDAGSEFFQTFSVLPSSVTADLQLTAGVVSSISSNGGGNGKIVWTGLNTNSVSFDYIRPVGLGVFLTEFEISSKPAPISEPNSMLIFLLGLSQLLMRKKFMKGNA